MDVLLDGVYEDIPFVQKLSATLRYFREQSPCVLIMDAPSDPVQFAAGRLVQLLGGVALTRWASTRFDRRRSSATEVLKRPFYQGWDGYLVTGQRALEYLASFRVPASKATICGNPVDSGAFAKPRKQNAPRRGTFLFVGRFVAVKNLQTLARAYRAYKLAGGSWGLVLVGFGEGEAELRKSTADLADVEFTGHLEGEALANRYASEGCLVLPSYSEPWGLVVNEAMHAGMPVIVSDTCGCVPELVYDGYNGFVLPPHDVAGWTQALVRMSALGARERLKIGRRSWALARQQSLERWVTRVGNAIDRAAQRRKREGRWQPSSFSWGAGVNLDSSATPSRLPGFQARR